MHDTATTAKSNVVLPLETHAEKDGTVTHMDGRLQRVRPSASRPGDIRPNILVLAELGAALDIELPYSQPLAFAALTEAVPFYSSITDADIGGRGIRWQETASSSECPAPGEPVGAGSPDTQRDSASGELAPTGSLALGTYRDLWAGPITELNPPLKFLIPQQRLEVSLADAERLELQSGDEVRVSQNGSSVNAHVVVKERVSEGVVFLAEGISGSNANSLLNGHQVSVEIEKLAEVPA